MVLMVAVRVPPLELVLEDFKRYLFQQEGDVEQGISDDHENLPLLSTSNTQPKHRQQQPAFRRPKHTVLQKLNVEPLSTTSTAESTPALETSESLPKKWRRSDRRLRRLNTELLEAIDSLDIEEAERLLKSGANPNATCRLDNVSACHLAALVGGDALSLLIKYGAEKHRLDKYGRTPLHLAAYAGNARQMAILLGLSEDIQYRVGSGDMSSEAEEDVKKTCQKTREMANVRCDLGEVTTVLPKNWKDNIDHNCLSVKGSIPLLQPGWSPLHVAVSCARRHCTRLLLAAGANPNICDEIGRTPFDVVGSAYYYNEEINSEHFTEVIKMLFRAGGRHNTMKSNVLNGIDTPLHVAVELQNIESIKDLISNGASVNCLNNDGLTPLHLCVKRRFEEPLKILANYPYIDADPLSALVDVKDKDGHTVLQSAVEDAWVPGVCIALEAGADVTLRANDGETPLHSAADLGNLDVLMEILSVAKKQNILDCQNEEGQTALFKAIMNGHIECVNALLEEGASIKIQLPGNVNVLHIATEYNHVEILRLLLEYNGGEAINMINLLTAGDRRGFGPVHFAVANNSVPCFELLLSKNADIRLRTTSSPHSSSTPLHLAATKNFIDVANFIVKYDKTTIFEVNCKGWYPLHTASHHGSRDVIVLLLQEGADLSGYTTGPKKYRRTAIDMILNNLSKPTEFMEQVFDSYISSNSQNFQEASCEIIVDYRILMPTTCEMKQMKVVEALLKTGNRYGQRRLLLHPLLESFLYLKWKALLPFFYIMIAVYAFYVASLTTFSISIFFYKDTNQPPPEFLDPNIWANILFVSVCMIILQELLYINKKSTRYLNNVETWNKFGSIILGFILPMAIIFAHGADWPRHIATLALLLSWIQMMFLLSRFPNWGYYVLMFGKVAGNVIKILLTFAFLVIGFSLSFMIQFRSQIPFESPWAAFVKTVVMMTSEFDYEALFDKEHSETLATSFIIVRLIFLVFLILAAIVLMNLMVGVAVSDINDLEIQGNINRLAKQVDFLSTLDNLVYNKFFSFVLPKRLNEKIRQRRRVMNMFTIRPGEPRWKYYKTLPSYLKDSILNMAQKQKKIKEQETNLEEFKNKINEMHEAITKLDMKQNEQIYTVKSEKPPKMKLDEVLKRLDNLDEGLDKVKEQVTNYTEESKRPIEEMTMKVDQLSFEIQNIKLFLCRLESKLDR
ncbi:transient receptor potential channel pyrexia-like [Zerene cesonia]|uniref:transient receptor potential channel pyrexia-like n=1 Tax=Zerene cesonia TaxID=33412 RepID=UPI0018E51FDE|nr:transient receptor potential channel pyrexia-like [Zerene cesonia]